MSKIKVSILGADGFTCQIPRIKEGMQELGHEVTQDSPNLIYSNDPRGYGEALILKEKYPSAYLILNFLDIPWHLPNVEKQTEALAKKYFSKAEALSVISFKVKNDIKKFYNKKIHVIYNPIKDVFFDSKIKKTNRFLYVGRANDPIKRIKLISDMSIKNSLIFKDLKICGTENPGFGKYLGVVSDKKLNEFYNSSKFLLLPSRAEGLGLTMIEGLICGCIPITCSDNLTAKEFSPLNFICKPNTESILKKIEELEKKYTDNKMLALKFGKKYKLQFDKKSIAKNIINIFNSK